MKKKMALLGMAIMIAGNLSATPLENLQKEYSDLDARRQQIVSEGQKLQQELNKILTRQTEIVGAAKYIQSQETTIQEPIIEEIKDEKSV